MDALGLRFCAVLSIVAMGLIGCVAAPIAQRPAPKTAQSAVAKPNRADDPYEVICRTETPSGSHRPVRDCRTRAAWEAARRSSTDALDDLQKRTPTLPKGN